MHVWADPVDVSALKVSNLESAGTIFRADGAIYRTTGERLGHGGMGRVFLLERREKDSDEPARAAAKVYLEDFLAQVAEDAFAGRHFEHNLSVMRRLRKVAEVHLMPVFAVEEIRDNVLQIFPHLGEPICALLDGEISPRKRVHLLLQAVRGLRALHERGLIHGDFTPRNILVEDPDKRGSVLFDFDLTIDLDALGTVTYLDHYGERVVGAPEYSVPPELIDPVLMQRCVSPRRDVYAVGTALYSMFSDASVYGDVRDLPTLLQRIADGVVRNGKTDIEFPDEVPMAVRDLILRCLERDPDHRYADASKVAIELERVHNHLSTENRSRFRLTLVYVPAARFVKLKDVIDQRPDQTVETIEIRRAFALLQAHGYQMERSLGRVKGHPIYVAGPDPVLLASGRFPGDNTYRKIVTMVDLSEREEPEAFANEWLTRIKPILDRVRTAHLTALHRVVVDRPAAKLMLFSEYLSGARFGSDIGPEDLSVQETLALGVIVISQVARLHEFGLAHNNVNLDSLLIKGFPATGSAQPLFVGLVDPSFTPADLANDVIRLAELTHDLLSMARSDELAGPQRTLLTALLANLAAIITGEMTIPTVENLLDMLCEGLGNVEPNFYLVTQHGGDRLGYAEMLIRHPLYRSLWPPPPRE